VKEEERFRRYNVLFLRGRDGASSRWGFSKYSGGEGGILNKGRRTTGEAYYLILLTIKETNPLSLVGAIQRSFVLKGLFAQCREKMILKRREREDAYGGQWGSPGHRGLDLRN